MIEKISKKVANVIEKVKDKTANTLNKLAKWLRNI